MDRMDVYYLQIWVVPLPLHLSLYLAGLRGDTLVPQCADIKISTKIGQ